MTYVMEINPVSEILHDAARRDLAYARQLIHCRTERDLRAVEREMLARELARRQSELERGIAAAR